MYTVVHRGITVKICIVRIPAYKLATLDEFNSFLLKIFCALMDYSFGCTWAMKKVFWAQMGCILFLQVISHFFIILYVVVE